VPAGQTLSNVTARAVKAALLEVKVVSAKNLKPIPGAAVGGFSFCANTDSNGVARLGLPAGKQELNIAKYGRHKETVSVKLESGRTNTLLYQLPPPISISGTVRNASGSPVPGVNVEYHPGQNIATFALELFFSRAITDEKGRYELQLLSEPRFNYLSFTGIESDNFVVAYDPVHNMGVATNFMELPERLDLVLQPGIAFSGNVRNDKGALMANAFVDIGFDYCSGWISPTPMRTGLDGAFKISGLPQGYTYDLEVFGSANYQDAHRIISAEKTRATSYVFTDLVLKSTQGVVSGTVLGVDGKPYGGATITVAGIGIDPSPRFAAESDANGHFVAEHVGANELQIIAHATKGQQIDSGLQNRAKSGDSNVVLQLQPRK